MRRLGKTLEPHSAISSVADEAKEKLHQLFASTPAGSAALPQPLTLPVQQRNQHDAAPGPIAHSATVAASEPGKFKSVDIGTGLTGQQSVITRLTVFQKKEVVRSLAQGRQGPSS